MPAGSSSDIKFEIGHVLFIDIVGYSHLLITDQSQQLQKLKEVVRATEQFRSAQAEGKLLRLPTGDGGALVFRTSPEAPVLCAMEISKALKSHPELKVRMGIHSGPVNEITDLNEQANIAGAGVNLAERVMDCGDAGHILLSQHVADDLEHYPRWRPYLHDLGTFEVKHCERINVTNLCSDEVGNPQLPSKLQAVRKHLARVRWAGIAASLLVLVAIIGGALFFLGRPGRSASAITDKSIAVLPFENLSRDPDNAFFTDGVQDQILTNLAQIADLKVISRTSVMQYKSGAPRNLREIGQQLGVGRVVKGSVQRAGNRVRVSAQLLDARNDAHMWAQTYDRDLADVFAIQSEIAKAIADQLQARLSPNEKKAIEQPPTSDVAAFDLYSRAKTLLLTTSRSPRGAPILRQVIDLLNQAVARDPSFFLAQCELVRAHDQLYGLGFDHTPARLTLADAALEAALRLRPGAGDTHLARAGHLYRGYRDYDGALAELEIARRTLPNDPRVFELTGYILRRRGQQEEGLRNLQRAVELDPRNFYTLQQIALSYFLLRRYSEEAAILDRALSIKPDDADTKVARASIPLNEKGDTPPLHQTLDEIRAKDPEAIKSVADSWLLCALAEGDAGNAQSALVALGDNFFGDDAVHLYRDFGEGLIARMANDEALAHAAFTAARREQEKRVQAQPAYGPALCVLGLIDAGLGRKEEALREGHRAMELLPVENDSVNGAHMIEYFAITAAWVGEKNLACDQLAKAVQVSGAYVSYGRLKLLPYWDPLRDDPRFEQIVASLAPKDAAATTK
jgi:TolB-like protein/class 3 adenylate cyclase